MKCFLYKNTHINYFESGKGNPVVLLHGFLENSTMWDFCIPEISKKNRIVTIDLLGHGQSECLGYIHTMEDQANMIFAVLQMLKIRKATLIGHSMGGYVALAFAELYPERIKSIGLINSTSFPDNAERKKNRNRAILMVKRDYSSFVRLSIANLFSEKNRNILVNEIENAKLEALKTPIQGIIAAQEGMKIRKSREIILQSANFLILLVLSKNDPVLDYDHNIKQIINTNVKLVTLQDGHMSTIENREQVIIIMSDFINN